MGLELDWSNKVGNFLKDGKYFLGIWEGGTLVRAAWKGRCFRTYRNESFLSEEFPQFWAKYDERIEISRCECCGRLNGIAQDHDGAVILVHNIIACRDCRPLINAISLVTGQQREALPFESGQSLKLRKAWAQLITTTPESEHPGSKLTSNSDQSDDQYEFINGEWQEGTPPIGLPVYGYWDNDSGPIAVGHPQRHLNYTKKVYCIFTCVGKFRDGDVTEECYKLHTGLETKIPPTKWAFLQVIDRRFK